MQMISKGFFKKKHTAEPWETIIVLTSSVRKKNHLWLVSNFDMCAKDHPRGPKQVLVFKINISLDGSLAEEEPTQ